MWWWFSFPSLTVEDKKPPPLHPPYMTNVHFHEDKRNERLPDTWVPTLAYEYIFTDMAPSLLGRGFSQTLLIDELNRGDLLARMHLRSCL